MERLAAAIDAASKELGLAHSTVCKEIGQNSGLYASLTSGDRWMRPHVADKLHDKLIELRIQRRAK